MPESRRSSPHPPPRHAPRRFLSGLAIALGCLVLGLTVGSNRGVAPAGADAAPCGLAGPHPTGGGTDLAACSERDRDEVHLEPARDGGGPLFGAFTYGGVWSGMEPVRKLESDLGRQLDVVHWFMNWQHAYDPRLVASAAQRGRLPLISWQPHRVPVRAIADGGADAYLRSWARGVAAHPGPVYLRPFPEMNGDWVPWNGEPEAFVRAWRRMVAIFREEGATNARWVWSPNRTDGPRTEANAMERYYPGDDVVDVLSLSGYNWGVVRDWSHWRSFDETFREPYRRLVAIGPQPVWLTEVASAERGGDKAAWIRGMLGSTSFPRLEAIVWFDEHKDADWRIRSSPEALAAFREHFRSAGLAETGSGAALQTPP